MANHLLTALHLKKRGVISLIGAGGKTSLMFRLAKEIADSGKRVLTTTTTKIFMPEKDNSPYTIVEGSLDKLVKKSAAYLDCYPHFSAGSEADLKSNKLLGFTKEFINQLWLADMFDWIIVEADGARRKPLKATNSHEPVVPGVTTHLVIVAGLDAVGTTLDETRVHRAKLFSDNTGLPLDEAIDEPSIARSIAVELKKAGRFCRESSNFVFLNKADSGGRVISGQKIAGLLEDNNTIQNIIVGSLIEQVPVKYTC